MRHSVVYGDALMIRSTVIVGLRERIKEVRGAGKVALANAAPRILAKLRGDARTRRGNVPSYGKFGDVPITSKVESNAIAVTAAGWVMNKADSAGQIDEWADIVREELREAVGGKR